MAIPLQLKRATGFSAVAPADVPALVLALVMALAGSTAPALAQQAAAARNGDPVPLQGPPPGLTGDADVGTIATGSTNVFIEGAGAARNADVVLCNTEVPSTGTVIASGATVFINGRPAARDGDDVTGCLDRFDGPVPVVVPVDGEIDASALTVEVGS